MENAKFYPVSIQVAQQINLHYSKIFCAKSYISENYANIIKFIEYWNLGFATVPQKQGFIVFRN
jgi:hypothetical protein